MIPSASSTGDLSWHAAPTADTWADHPAAAAAVGGAYSSSTSNVATDSRYLNLHRHQILDWENAMLLAHHEPVYDQVQDDYSKPSSMPSMHAEAIPSLSHPRHYENLLSAHMHASASTSLSSNNAWGLLNTVCTRNSGGQLQVQQEAASTFLQAASAPYTYDSCLTHEGAEGLVGYGGLPGTGGLYADPLRSNSSTGGNMIGLSSFDQRRLDDIVKRELYTTHDFNSRLGLNLGGRTYFSAADDFAFGRWGKRLRPNSPGCMMQPAPLCQAEGCKADLSMAKHYHRRHKVCEYHSKAATVHIGEQTQRFCQQCSRFHVLAEFDDGKRSCRKRLADHNRRRRKPQPAPTLAIDAAGDAKDQSQEAPTRSESPQNGTQSSKGSPTQQVEDQQLMSTKPTPSSPTGNANEASSRKGQLHVVLEQEKVEHEKAGANSSSSSQSKLKSDGSSAMTLNSKSTTTSMPSELAGNSTPLAANLSLGAASDIADVNPTAASSGLLPHKGSHFDSASTHAAHVMPWLQGSKKHSSLQGFPYDSTTKSDHNVEMVGGAAAGRVLYGERGSDSQSRSCWMMKGMMGEASEQTEKDTLMSTSSRHGAKSGSGETAGGGHELLRLLGDETRELLSSNKQSAAAMQSNPSTVGTLAFFEQSLEQQSPSGFLRDSTEQQRMIQFSSLHQRAAGEDEEQVQQGRSHLPMPTSKFSFGNHNHFI